MTVPDEGTFAVRAEPAAAAAAPAATGPSRERTRWLLPAGALLLVAVLALYLADLVTHLSYMAAMRDLVVYRDVGLIVRHVAPAYNGHRAAPLYDWIGQNGVQFTYPPFAAVVFAVASVLPWTVLRWAMTLASLAALIFIPYLLLIRKFRQAATATTVFAATVGLGYALLPRDSGDYWAGRLFLNGNRIVFLGARGQELMR